MRFTELNDDNFLLFAIKHYDNPNALTKDDFLEDLKRFKYIKRLLKRYDKTGILKTHLLLNHIIVVYNIFGDAATPLLFYKIDRDLWSVLKSFMMFLGRMPEYPKSFIHDIMPDIDCLSHLQRI